VFFFFFFKINRLFFYPYVATKFFLLKEKRVLEFSIKMKKHNPVLQSFETIWYAMATSYK